MSLLCCLPGACCVVLGFRGALESEAASLMQGHQLVCDALNSPEGLECAARLQEAI